MYLHAYTTALLHASNYLKVIDFCLHMVSRFIPSFNPALFIEICGSVGSHARNIFPNAEYYNIGIKNSNKFPTIVADICEIAPVKDVDFVFSPDCFDHIKKPCAAGKK